MAPDPGDRAGWASHLVASTGARQGRLPAWASPAPGRRAEPSVALRLGRRLFAAKQRMVTLVHEGATLSDPKLIEAAL